MRWLLLAAALAPAILAYILVRGHKLTWPPGEMTMVVGFTAFVLVFYNGIMDKPAPDAGIEFGESLDYGYWVALLCSTLVIAFDRLLQIAEVEKRRGPAQGAWHRLAGW